MKNAEFQKMPLDELWQLHQKVMEALDRKLDSEKRKLQNQLDELGRKFGRSKDNPQRRPYPKVEPKYRNPSNTAETWSGRGKIPRWLALLIASGRQREEFQIRPSGREQPPPRNHLEGPHDSTAAGRSNVVLSPPS